MIMYGAYARAICRGVSRRSSRRSRPSSGTCVLPPATTGAGVTGVATAAPVGLPDAQQRDEGAGGEQRATMSDNSTEMKFESRIAHREADARQHRSRPGLAHPSRAVDEPTRISGTKRARNGVCRPTIEPRSSMGPVTVGERDDRRRDRAERDRCGVPISASAAAFIGVKPSASSITAVIATGVPKPARASISAPKQKAMMMAWMRWSSETPRTIAAARRSARVDRHVVDPDRVDDDPQDREEAERRPLETHVQRLPDGHVVDEDRDQQRDRERGQPRDPRGHAEAAEQHEQGRSAAAPRRSSSEPSESLTGSKTCSVHRPSSPSRTVLRRRHPDPDYAPAHQALPAHRCGSRSSSPASTTRCSRGRAGRWSSCWSASGVEVEFPEAQTCCGQMHTQLGLRR